MASLGYEVWFLGDCARAGALRSELPQEDADDLKKRCEKNGRWCWDKNFPNVEKHKRFFIYQQTTVKDKNTTEDTSTLTGGQEVSHGDADQLLQSLFSNAPQVQCLSAAGNESFYKEAAYAARTVHLRLRCTP